MAPEATPSSPFATKVLGNGDDTTDVFPACYHHYKALGKERCHSVTNPAGDVMRFLETQLSLGNLGEMQKHLWFAGSKRPTTQLHLQIAMGREIVVADRMDLHLLWSNDGRIFLKPIPRFVIDPDFWTASLNCHHIGACEHLKNAVSGEGDGGRPSVNCQGQHPVPECRHHLRRVALGFLYTYACLLSSEIDFLFAKEKHLLPRKADDSEIEWTQWKELVRQLLQQHDPGKVHPRFLRAELRLSRINTIHRFTRLPPFNPYLRGWHDYKSLFRDNLAWMVTAAIFLALVLTAMQVGLATERLQGNAGFQRASYGFTVFALLGPICAFGLVVLGALFNLTKDLPRLVAGETAQIQTGALVSDQHQKVAAQVQDQDPQAQHDPGLCV